MNKSAFHRNAIMRVLECVCVVASLQEVKEESKC